MTTEILPSSVPVIARKTKMLLHEASGNIIPFVMCYCANCGKEGVWIPEAQADGEGGFMFYLCDDCGTKWSPIDGYHVVPDDALYERNKHAMIEKEGRELTSDEIVERLRDPNDWLHSLKRS